MHLYFLRIYPILAQFGKSLYLVDKLSGHYYLLHISYIIHIFFQYSQEARNDYFL